jgi:hypothetical protein
VRRRCGLGIKRTAAALALVLVTCLGGPLSAHVAFSSVELRVIQGSIEVTVVSQAYDLAHELGVDPPERLVDLNYLASQHDALATLMNQALTIERDGALLDEARWDTPAAAPEQQLIRMHATFPAQGGTGRLTMTSRLFSYDTAHQTLVTVYEGDALKTQQMLDAARPSFDYFTGTRAGIAAGIRRFLAAGFERSLTGYDHLLFLAALLLVGGTLGRLGSIFLAFTISCAAALAAGASGVLAVPLYIVAPGVALSIVYAGVDNVLARGGRDMRVWVALVFGAFHGLALASVLDAMDLPSGRGFAIAAFNVGVECGFILAAIGVASISAVLLAQAATPMRRMFTTAASAAIAIAGIATFVSRLLSP